jgi:hypothetical protein
LHLNHVCPQLFPSRRRAARRSVLGP